MADKKDNKVLIGAVLLGIAAIVGFFIYKNRKPKQEVLNEESKVLKDAYDNLSFETGKDIIKTMSFPFLDELAGTLNEAPKWKLSLAGHTDNTGSPQFNQELSKKRADSVKKYLVSKGVSSDRISTSGFGDTQPIADNSTPDGREKNRRVEFTIIKEEGKTLTT